MEKRSRSFPSNSNVDYIAGMLTEGKSKKDMIYELSNLAVIP